MYIRLKCDHSTTILWVCIEFTSIIQRHLYEHVTNSLRTVTIRYDVVRTSTNYMRHNYDLVRCQYDLLRCSVDTTAIYYDVNTTFRNRKFPLVHADVTSKSPRCSSISPRYGRYMVNLIRCMANCAKVDQKFAAFLDPAKAIPATSQADEISTNYSELNWN